MSFQRPDRSTCASAACHIAEFVISWRRAESIAVESVIQGIDKRETASGFIEGPRNADCRGHAGRKARHNVGREGEQAPLRTEDVTPTGRGQTAWA